MDFSILKGKVLRRVNLKADSIYADGRTRFSIPSSRYREIVFECKDFKRYRLYHKNECCEDVFIEDVCGNLNDLAGSEILLAEEVSSEFECEGEERWSTGMHSITYTFYKLATIKGSVDIRWHGNSNGFYSEKVDFEEIVEESE